MNTKAKLLSLCLAAVLLCGCIVGFMMTGASAEEITWTVDGIATDVANNTYVNLQAALDQAAQTTWASDAELVINITSTKNQILTRSNDGIFGGVKTIWRGNRDSAKGDIEYGNKLPITIIADDGAGAVVCGANDPLTNVFTNDYTFVNVAFGYGKSSNKRYLYGGSGEVIIQDSTFANPYYYVYGDNTTLAAYAGWKQGDVDKIKEDNEDLIPSSITLDGVKQLNTSDSTAFTHEAVGYNSSSADAFAAATDPSTVTVDVKPSDCKVTYALQGDSEFGVLVDDVLNPQLTIYNNRYNTPYGDAEVILDAPYKAMYGYEAVASASHSTNMTFTIGQFGSLGSNDTVPLYSGTFSGKCTINFKNGLTRAVARGKTTFTEDAVINVNYHSGEYASLNAFTLGNSNSPFAGKATVTVKSGVTVTTFNGAGGTGKYEAGTIHNIIEAGAEIGAFNGNAKAVTSVTNDIHGTVTGDFKGTAEAVTGNVYNNFHDGCHVMGVVCSADSDVNGEIVNTFFGGTFDGTIRAGNYLADTTKVTNIVEGGTFNGIFYASGVQGNTKGDDPLTTTAAENYISGGTFKEDFFCGTLRGNVVNVTTYISGDAKFEKRFYGGSSANTLVSTTFGSSTVYIFGGVFDGSFDSHLDEAGLLVQTGSIVYNIYRNDEKLPANALEIAKVMYGKDAVAADLLTALEFGGKLTAGEMYGDAVNVYAGDADYLLGLGSDPDLDFTGDVDGKIYFDKMCNWYEGDTNVKLLTGTEFEIDLDKADIYGYGEIAEGETYTYIKTKYLAPAKVNLVLDEKINVVLYYDAAEIEGYWDNIANDYNVISVSLGTLDVNTFSEANKVDLNGVEHYKFVISGISPADLTADITISNKRNYNATTTLAKILENTKKGAGAELVALCDAIAALAGDDASEKGTVVMDGAYAESYDNASVNVNAYGIVMNDAVGYTIYGTVAEDATYTVEVNDVVVDAKFNADGMLDIFVKVARADDMMKIEILDADGNTAFEMKASVEQIANLYGADHEGYVLATNMLAYIQAANNYLAASL